VALPRGILSLLAAGFAGFGLAYALWPGPMAAVTDIGLPTGTAHIDFVATYGGFQLGFAAYLVLCARRNEQWLRAGLLAAGCALLGFALARGISLLRYDNAAASIYTGLAIEITGAALALWGYRRSRESRSESSGRV
jgi:hypothetical protein